MLEQIKKVFEQHASKVAFCISGDTFRYSDWLEYICGIRKLLQDEKPNVSFIGVAAYDSIETYAAILATWAEGYAFVPLSPLSSPERNASILSQVESDYILSSKDEVSDIVSEKSIQVLVTKDLKLKGSPPDFSELEEGQIMSMLFTSGSTGVPKGVPYTAKNINATLDAFWALEYGLTEKDRFLQMFELTFDMSMLSYLPAWCIGASVHTVNRAGVKYLNAFKVMHEQELTFAAMVPSTLQLLRPYFAQINLPALRVCMLGGEPLYTDLAKEWMLRIPNARVINISGPCETTMACMGYELEKEISKHRSHKGILAFGSPWKNTSVLLLNENNEPAKIGEKGELCFGGDHVMEGYWKMPALNEKIFFYKKVAGKDVLFYRSGDMAFQDEDGVYYSCGRKDIQYKIQGFKVELGDLEQHARKVLKKGNVVALVNKNDKGLLDIHLFVDAVIDNLKTFSEELEKHLPSYMQPRSIKVLKNLPLTLSGKIDRPRVQAIFEGDDFDFVKDGEIAKRIEDNLFENYRKAGSILDLPIWKNDNVEAVDAHPKAWPRTLFGVPSEDQMKELSDAIRMGQLPPRLIVKRPEEEDFNLKLSEHGFRQLMTWPGMAMNLNNYNPDIEKDSVRLIKNKEELQKWLAIINEVLFNRDPIDIDLVYTLWQSKAFLFYGFWEGEDIRCTTMTFDSDQGLGIYMVATDPKYRSRGFAKATMKSVLMDGKQRGAKVAYLQSSFEGEAMYKKIGFKIFCNFDIFWLLGVR